MTLYAQRFGGISFPLSSWTAPRAAGARPVASQLRAQSRESQAPSPCRCRQQSLYAGKTKQRGARQRGTEDAGLVTRIPRPQREARKMITKTVLQISSFHRARRKHLPRRPSNKSKIARVASGNRACPGSSGTCEFRGDLRQFADSRLLP